MPRITHLVHTAKWESLGRLAEGLPEASPGGIYLGASGGGGGYYLRMHIGGLPRGAVVENLPADAGDMGSSPGLGGSHMPRSN